MSGKAVHCSQVHVPGITEKRGQGRMKLGYFQNSVCCPEPWGCDGHCILPLDAGLRGPGHAVNGQPTAPTLFGQQTDPGPLSNTFRQTLPESGKCSSCHCHQNVSHGHQIHEEAYEYRYKLTISFVLCILGCTDHNWDELRRASFHVNLNVSELSS